MRFRAGVLMRPGGRSHPAGRSAPPRRRLLFRLAALAACLLLPSISRAAPWVWDDDGDHIDDRVENVSLLGYNYSFVGNDTLLQQRFEVARGPLGNLFFGVYVVFDHEPNSND